MDKDIENRVIERASELFSRHGIKAITMDYIASDMGISKRTLYEMFTDKDSLLIKTIERGENLQKKEKETISQKYSNAFELNLELYKSTLHRLRRVNRNYLGDLKRYHPKVWALLEKNKEENMRERIQLTELGIEEGFIRPELNSEVLNLLLQAQFEVLLNSEVVVNGRYDFAEVFETIVMNYARGIATPKGLKLLEKCD